MKPPPGITAGSCGQLACILEATAEKPGNVHRSRDFEDTTYLDFILSAAAIAPALDQAAGRGIGETVLDGIERTLRVVSRNTNLGVLLLLGPLSAVFESSVFRDDLKRLLGAATVKDSRLVYRAIRLARPGGLGEAPVEDVRSEPTRPLLEVMKLAAGRDLIARQYETEFQDVFGVGLPALDEGTTAGLPLEAAVVLCHLRFLSLYPDSLIARKCGTGEANRARELAREVLARDWPTGPGSREAFAALDGWLRADGNRRNPGATADLTAASIFVAIREGSIHFPVSRWSDPHLE